MPEDKGVLSTCMNGRLTGLACLPWPVDVELEDGKQNHFNYDTIRARRMCIMDQILLITRLPMTYLSVQQQSTTPGRYDNGDDDGMHSPTKN